MAYVKYIIIGLTYFGLALGYFPGLRMNRATIALVGSGLLIASRTVDLSQAWQAIDPTTIVFLLSMMVVNSNLAYAGFFRLAIVKLIRLTRSPFELLLVITFGSGLLSTVFLNDTMVLVFTPLVLTLTTTLGLNPIPYLLAMASATNLGSVATLSGNPQNILVGSFSGIGYLDFAQALSPIALMGLVLQIGWLWWLYPEVRSCQPRSPIALPEPRIFKPLFLKTGIITGALLTAFVVGLPLAESALAAASLLLITRRIKPERTLKSVEWDLLLLFSGLFILTKATRNLNIFDAALQSIVAPEKLLAFTTVLSNLISNVPAVLLIHPAISPDDTNSWLRLAAASTLAGNLTLFGSVANLIVVEAAARLGHRLSFWEHLRFGMPLTIVMLLITYWWI
jgi:Na+/H+ antiporter NhaD/arsenite permease-like protein